MLETKEALPKFLNQKQVAEILGKSTAWLERMRWKGDGPPFRKFGRHVRYSLEGGLLLTGTVKLEWQKLNEDQRQTVRNCVAYCKYLDPEAPWDDFNDLELKTIILNLHEGFIGSVTVVEEDDVLGFWWVHGWEEWLLENPQNIYVYPFASQLSF